VAEMLQKHFPKNQGYSLYVPISRQEKAVDLSLLYRDGIRKTFTTFQIKASRPYSVPSKRFTVEHGVKFCSWFNTFKVHEAADFYILLGMFPVDGNVTKKSASSWEAIPLCFTNAEMITFLADVRTKAGNLDSKFSFAYLPPNKVIQIRGDQFTKCKDFANHLLDRRSEEIRSFTQR
jgi:hypothetical protein